jgi:hypothetical protein
VYNADEGRLLTGQFYPGCTRPDVLMRQLDPECRDILHTLAASYTDW